MGLNAIDSARSEHTFKLAHHSPTAHGMLRIAVTLENDLVTSASPILGSMHRGAEKLFESRDYRQILMLANRHEWLCAFSGEVGLAELIEKALGLEVPEAAKWLRTLMLEINRITAHLAFVAGFAHFNDKQVHQVRALREEWIEHVQLYTGSRMHPMLTRIGGMTHAPTTAWLENLEKMVATSQETLQNFRTETSELLAALQGVGRLTADEAQSLALSGPVARASGYSIDLRESSNQQKYSELASWRVVTHTQGDVASRMVQLLDELELSCHMVHELMSICSQHVSSDVNVLLPKVLRVPEGAYEHSIETPLGIASWFMVSRNDKMPYKLKLRPASLHTVLAVPEVLRNAQVEHLAPIITSMPFIAGDVDR